MDDRIGEILVETGRLTSEQVAEALATQLSKGGRLGEHLISLGHLQETELMQALSTHFGVPALELNEIDIDSAVIQVVPAELARKYTILPISKAAARLTLAMVDPSNVFALDDVKFMTGYTVEPVLATEDSLLTAIDRFYGSSHAVELKRVMDDINDEAFADLEVLDDDEDVDLEELEEQSSDAPVVRLVNMILMDAVKRGASDILQRCC